MHLSHCYTSENVVDFEVITSEDFETCRTSKCYGISACCINVTCVYFRSLVYAELGCWSVSLKLFNVLLLEKNGSMCFKLYFFCTLSSS